jgi:biopolymer transport protein ExbD
VELNVNKQTNGSGGAAVAVVVILLLLVGGCGVAVLVGGFFLLGVRSVAPPVITPPPAPTVVKVAQPLRIVRLTVAADSALTLDGSIVTLDEIPGRLQQLRANTPTLDVAVQADPAATADIVQQVLKKLSESGVPHHVQTPPVAPPLPPSVPESPSSAEAPASDASESP